MWSCSLVIVHASLKNMVSRKTRLKFLVPNIGGRTWRDEKIHDFHNFSNGGLKFYIRFSKCICNRIMMKKNIDFLTHLQEKLPLSADTKIVSEKTASRSLVAINQCWISSYPSKNTDHTGHCLTLIMIAGAIYRPCRYPGSVRWKYFFMQITHLRFG